MSSGDAYRHGVIVGSIVGVASFVVVASTNSIWWMIPYTVAAIWLIAACEPIKETKRG